MSNENHTIDTLKDLLEWGVTELNQSDAFYGHGALDSWDEVVYLALHVLNLPPDADKSVENTKITKEQRNKIMELIHERIEKRIPAAYLIHEAWFAGYPFYVDERVLIPRSPITELIENQFVPWIDPDSVKNVLEIGTGSGCIAIATALNFPDAKVDATDISEDALEVAKINVKKHEVEGRVHLIKSDVYSAIPNKKYDIIVSNPPYVDLQDMTDMPKEYHFEPKLALEGGDDGLDIVVRILDGAKEHLTDDGIVIVEVGNSEEALLNRFPHMEFIWPDFERTEGGVFILMASQLDAWDKERK